MISRRFLAKARVCGPTLVTAALFASLMPGPARADTACRFSSDEKSVYVRALQTDLMVAALTCSDSEKYNSFIHQFQPSLIENSKRLQAYYKKKNGRSGASELNTFVTHLANDESQRSIQLGQVAYCAERGKLFQAALGAHGGPELEELATQVPISADAPVHQCVASASTSVVSSSTR